MSYGITRTEIKEILFDIFEQTLGLERTELEQSDTFKELGIGSLNAVELLEAINVRFDLNLPTSIVFECADLESLAVYMEKQFHTLVQPAKQAQPTVSAPTPAPTPKPAPAPTPTPPAREARVETEEIAIIGLSVRSAGANDQEEFWNLIRDGKKCISEVSDPKRLEYIQDHSSNPFPINYGKMDDIDRFDPLFFNISAIEAEKMDVTQRILLEEAYKSLEDAGYTPTKLRGQPVGTFIGTAGSSALAQDFSHYSMLGYDISILAARMAYYLDLKGPALAVNTACSSSMVAIDLACQQLKSGEINLAIAGGITVYSHPGSFISMHNAGMLSPNGECRPFDDGANGIVVGDGVGVLILKRLCDAERDNDHIYGIIRGSGTNQDGQTSGITAPSFLAQSQLQESIYRKYEIDVEDIQYIEAHGTGTKLGDPIEIHALNNTFRKFTTQTGFCGIGSLKANIGHTTAAAGVLGVIKVLMSMKHGEMPPSIQYAQGNKHIDFANSPVFVNTARREWTPNRNGKRLAAVNSFGYSGTNAHMVIEDYSNPSRAVAAPINEAMPGLFVLSAQSAESLQANADAALRYLRSYPDVSLPDFLYTYQVARESMAQRLAIVVKDRDQLIGQLERYLAGAGKSGEVFVGTVGKNGSVNVINLADTEEGQAFLLSLLHNCKLKTIAELWVNGNRIDWEGLYPAGTVKRLTGLPTYSFAQERYPLPAFQIVQTGFGKQGKSAVNALHPLLHRNTSDLNEMRYSTVFAGEETFLRDRMVPEFALLEMARAAVEQASGALKEGRTRLCLQNIVWESPLAVGADGSQVHIALYLAANGEISFEIYNDEEELHASGSALLTEDEAPLLDASTLQERGARVTLPMVPSQFLLHPHLLDTVLQGSVPATLQEVAIYAPCPPSMWVVADDGNFTFCDEQGKVCLQISGLQTQKNRPQAVSPSAEPFALMTFEEIWQEKARNNHAPSNLNTLLCFLSNAEAQRAVVEAVQARSPQTQVLFVVQGTSCQQALRSVQEQQGEVDALLYLWPLEDASLVEDTKPILDIVQALATTKLKAKSLMLVGQHRNATERAFLESWIGFERSLGLVLPDTRAAVVMQEAGAVSLQENMHLLLDELNASKIESVLYQNSKRHVCKVQPTRIQAGSSTLLKSGGTYLITGGLGGLGYLLAEHLAGKHTVNLILTGRSALDAAKQAKIEALEKRDSRVFYLQADVCDRTRMEEGLAEARSQFGRVHGVLHAAGLVGAESILDKDDRRFQQVLDSKVKGTLLLDELLQGEPELDFTCYFSSSSAIIGDFGSCDYSIANRFQMAYGELRNGTTFVINWPLWKAGGMHFEKKENTEAYFKTSGQRFLEVEEGLAIFDRILSQNRTQHLVMVGQPSRIERMLGLAKSAAPTPVPVDSGSNTSCGKGRRPEMKGFTLEQCVEWDLKEQISSVLKIPRTKLDVEENLADFGFDSISLAEFAGFLSKHYSIAVTPALFFDHSTIRALTQFYAVTHGEAMRGFYQEQAASAPAIAAAPVAPNVSTPSKRPSRKKTGKARFAAGGAVRSAQEPIAIVGISGRFPQASNVQELWKNIRDGKEAITAVLSDRWDWREEKGMGKWGGFVPDVDRFDPLFFKISPKEAEYIDPKQRLFLQEAWHALEDAGYMGERIRGTACGVYVGVEEGEYGFLAGEDSPLNSNQNATLAARISYALNLKGPNMAITAACSSGLVAIHQACQALRQGECDMALAGGVSLLVSPMIHNGMGKLDMLSPDGTCFVFDGRANGLVPSEAVAVVVLKPLSKALEDGDQIYGCIKGSAVNYDGQTNGITAPSPASQADLLHQVYKRFGINPADIQFVLSHSVGSRLGDPIEVQALTNAFRRHTDRTQYCALGSIKPLIGHTFAASGVVSLISMLMAMKERTIPALHNYESSNDYINLTDSPFVIHTKNRSWTTADERPRLGAVSTTGISGTNAHLVVEEYIPAQQEAVDQEPTEAPQIIVLSAKNRERLDEVAAQLLAFLEADESLKLPDIAHTLKVGRDEMEARLAMVVQSRDELMQGLRGYLKKGDAPIVLYLGDLNESHSEILDLLAVITGETVLRALLAEGNLGKLALYWAKGGKIPWEALQGGASARRISLPTYPFERRRCWLTAPTIARRELTTQSLPAVAAASASEAAPVSEEQDLAIAEDLQERVIGIISELVGLKPAELKVNKPLDHYGFDSILFMQLLQQIQTQIDPSFSFVKLSDCRSMEDLIRELVPNGTTKAKPKAEIVSQTPTPPQAPLAAPPAHKPVQTSLPQFPELVLLNQATEGRPIFWMHGTAGGVGIYSMIAKVSNRPFYGIKARGWMSNRTPIRGIYAMAAYYVHIIQSVQPEGPYDFGGYSLGGLLAYEVARQLQELGQKVNSIMFLDTLYSDKIYTKTILPEAMFNRKTAILQSVNMSLLTEIQHEPEKIPTTLIHRDDLDPTLSDEEYSKQLLSLARERGYKRTEDYLNTMIQSSSDVQEAIDRSGFTILPLTYPQEVSAYFFRNKSGSFLGALEPYFKVKTSPVFDQGDYWSEFERQIDDFHLFDIDSSNHMMLLSEPKAAASILAFSQELYSAFGLDPTFLVTFAHEHRSCVGTTS